MAASCQSHGQSEQGNLKHLELQFDNLHSSQQLLLTLVQDFPRLCLDGPVRVKHELCECDVVQLGRYGSYKWLLQHLHLATAKCDLWQHVAPELPCLFPRFSTFALSVARWYGCTNQLSRTCEHDDDSV